MIEWFTFFCLVALGLHLSATLDQTEWDPSSPPSP